MTEAEEFLLRSTALRTDKELIKTSGQTGCSEVFSIDTAKKLSPVRHLLTEAEEFLLRSTALRTDKELIKTSGQTGCSEVFSIDTAKKEFYLFLRE